jgi:hypothetical protein
MRSLNMLNVPALLPPQDPSPAGTSTRMRVLTCVCGVLALVTTLCTLTVLYLIVTEPEPSSRVPATPTAEHHHPDHLHPERHLAAVLAAWTVTETPTLPVLPPTTLRPTPTMSAQTLSEIARTREVLQAHCSQHPNSEMADADTCVSRCVQASGEVDAGPYECRRRGGNQYTRLVLFEHWTRVLAVLKSRQQ